MYIYCIGNRYVQYLANPREILKNVTDREEGIHHGTIQHATTRIRYHTLCDSPAYRARRLDYCAIIILSFPVWSLTPICGYDSGRSDLVDCDPSDYVLSIQTNI